MLGLVLVIAIRTMGSKFVGKIILFDIFMLDFLLVPLLIITTTKIIKGNFLEWTFFKLGKHSTNIWLMHSYFTLSYFQDLVFYPRYSILILIFTFILTTSISKIIFLGKDKISIIKSQELKLEKQGG
ncbi:hypothetical protein HS141_16150 [Cetobacterium somerae]|uniref:hypothetical protein n=1 Tax=Cetobacterium somerae TaxID=188913 RepID=UPI00211EFA1D|nr:hypothetical protein [Cetobacterium somerae]MCQ9628451.1 hypothetical protein [Cetobacterium somerae]